MIKNYFYFLVTGLFLFHLTVSAQQKDELQLALDDIFSKINKAPITTGLLYDNTLHQSKLLRFDGKRDTILKGYDWKEIYRELYNMQIRSLVTPLPQPDTLSGRTMQLYTQGINPLIIMNMDYNITKADAFQNRLLDTLNNQVIDVWGRTQSPYETKQLFAFSPAHSNMGYNPVKFYLGSEYYFTNKPGALPKIEIDFGDGNGFRSVFWNSYVSITYYTSSAVRTIKIRILSQSLTASGIYYPPANAIHSSSPVFYKQGPIPPSTAPNGEYEKKITADIPYNGEVLSGYYTVSYARNPQTGRINKYLTRPVILVEGIDFGYKDQPYGRNGWNKCGSLGFVDLAAGKDHTYDKHGEPIVKPFEDGNLTLAPDLIKSLNNNGYDFIYLDFEKGAEYMQKNAMVLIKLIQEINSLKQDPCEELVVVGASMGGQVARYALSYMESHGLPHNVRLFGTFDSPNNGANIPIGFQYFIDYYADKTTLFFGDAKDARERKLTTPAARQLLLYHFEKSGGPHPLRIKFLNELKAMGDYPQKLRKIAVANGSGTVTTQNFNAGDFLLRMTIPISTIVVGGVGGAVLFGPVGAVMGPLVAKHTVHDYEASVYAVTNGRSLVFKGTAPGDAWRELYSQPGTLAYDNCPGGTNAATYNSAYPAKNTLLNGLLVDTYGGPASFMATVSALGLKPPYNSNLFLNIDNNTKQILLENKYTPFDEFYIQSDNQAHVTITNDNIDWFVKQLKLSDPSLQADRLEATLPWVSGNQTYNTYNYGNQQNMHFPMPSVSIGSGGVLKVNDAGNTGYGAGPVTIQGSTVEIHTKECGTMIEVGNGGQFILGQNAGANSTNNKAIVLISSGGILKIKNGGKLIINNNSTLIIEPGAKLIYEQGAEIQLLGDNAVLEIQGTLELGTNANFTFTFPNSNSGYVKFNMPTPVPFALTRNITAGTGARMTFKGADINDKVLEVTQEGMYPPDNISFFMVIDGTVALGEGSRVTPTGSSTAISLRNARITSTSGTNNAHRGLTIFGQRNVTIDGCVFENGTYGIYAFLTYGGNSLKIARSTFQNCKYGLWTHDKGVNFTTCTFDNNTEEAWHAEAMALPCKTYAGSMTNTKPSAPPPPRSPAPIPPPAQGRPRSNPNLPETPAPIPIQAAIAFNGGSGSSLNLDHPNISSNFRGVYVSGSTALSIWCGNINNNAYGVFLQNNASLFLDMNPVSLSASMADLGNNGITINAEDAGMLYLSNGNNNLEPMQHRGPFPATAISGTLRWEPNNSSSYTIDASSNMWRTPGGIGLNYLRTSTGKEISVQDNSPLDVFSECTSNPGPGVAGWGKKAQDPLSFCPNCRTVNSPGFHGVALNLAVQQSINTTQIANPATGNDLTAITLFSDILTSPAPQQSHWRFDYLNNLAYTQMTQTLGNAIATGSIPQQGPGIPLSPYVQKVVDVQNTLIAQARVQNNNPQVFSLSMDKGQVYRLANQRQQALQVFDSIKICSVLDTNQSSYLNYWRNITYAEQLVLSGQIPKENVETLMQQASFGAAVVSNPGINFFDQDTAYCTNDTVKFSPGEYSVTYNWDFGDCSTSTAINPTHVYAAPGIYTVTLTQSFACTTKTRTSVVAIYPHPQPSFAMAAPACPLKDVFLFSNTSLPLGEGQGGACNHTALDTSLTRIQYTWDFGDGNSVTDTLKINPSHQYNVPGVFPVVLTAQVQAKDTGNAWVNTSCSATFTDTVTVEEALTASFNTDTVKCFADSVHLTSTTSGGRAPYTYYWDFGNGDTSSLATPVIKYTSAGTYTVTLIATDAKGCSDAVSTTISVPPPITASISAGGATTFCEGNSVTLTASSANTYSWSNGASTQNITVSASGDYVVTVTDANGCTASSAITKVTVNPLPVATITASGALTFCEGNSVTLTASSANTYSWSNGASTQSITLSASGDYAVTVTDANGCTASSAITKVTVTPLPVATITASGATTFCEGNSVTLTASSANTYSWSNGASTQSITVSASGDYAVTVTDINGCSASSAITKVTVTPLPVATITASGALTFCEGNSVTLTASSANTYSWSNGASTQSITVSASGDYVVTVTDANGCTASSAITKVMVNPLPVATITTSGATTFCEGNSVTLTASSANTYSWSNGASTQSITVSASGNYTVTVTNANGCTASSNITSIIVNPLPAISIAQNGDFCQQGAITLNANSSGAVSYVWSTGETTQIISIFASGNYSVNATNANGCSNIALQTITLPECIPSVISGTLFSDPSCGGMPVANTSLVLVDASNNIIPGLYVTTDWNGFFSFDLSLATAALSPTATYTFATADGIPLDGTIFKTLNEWSVQNPVSIATRPINISFSYAPIYCYADSVHFTANVSGGNSPYYFWDFGNGDYADNVLNPVEKYNWPGIYDVTFMAWDNSGCYSSYSQPLFIDDCPLLPIFGTLTGSPDCGGMPVTYTSLTVVDTAYNILQTVYPAMTDVDGIFYFDPYSFSTLSPGELITFAAEDGTPLDSTNFKTIAEWSNQSPVQLVLKPITANYTYAPIRCFEDSIYFTANVSGGTSPVYYFWNFGNGNYANDVLNPVEKYDWPGTYDVTLEAWDNSGCYNNYTQTLAILECPQPAIYGMLYENPSCGTSLVTGQQLVLLDNMNNIVLWSYGMDGTFNFDYNTISMLNPDTNALYTIATPDGKSLQGSGYKTLNEWVRQSPLDLFLTGQVNQEWVARYNGSGNTDDFAITVDAQNCLIVAGSSPTLVPNYNTDMVIVKYDPQGSQQWEARYNGTSPGSADAAVAVTTDKYSNVYAVGVTNYNSNPDWITIKYDSNGTMLWENQYSGKGNGWDIPVAIAIDASGNTYVSGYGVQTGLYWDWDFVTIKYDPNGVKLWEMNYNNYSSSSIDRIVGMALDNNGNVYVTGISNSNSSSSQEFITIKYDTDGNQLWVAKYDGQGTNTPSDPTGIVVDTEGNAYITGQTFNNISSSITTTIKYDASGTLQWVQHYDQSYNSPIAIAIDAYNNVYVEAYDYALLADYKTIKYNSNGEMQWAQHYDAGNTYDSPYSLAIDANSNVYVTGYSSGYNYLTTDFATVKYNKDGQQEWVQRSNESVDSLAIAVKVAVSSNGNVYVTGFTKGAETGYDFTTIKYSQCQETAYLLKRGDFAFEEEQTKEKITSSSAANFVNVYPNPNNGSMQVEYVLPEEQEAEFAIFDLIGNRLKTYTLKGGKNTFYIADAELKSGVYFYQVISNKQRIKQDKLVIIR